MHRTIVKSEFIGGTVSLNAILLCLPYKALWENFKKEQKKVMNLIKCLNLWGKAEEVLSLFLFEIVIKTPDKNVKRTEQDWQGGVGMLLTQTLQKCILKGGQKYTIILTTSYYRKFS